MKTNLPKFLKITTLVTLPILGLLFVQPVSAQVLSHQDLQIDSSISGVDQSYNIPSRIAIVPIFPPTSDFNQSDTEWFRGLYYYLISNPRRPGFTDIPFHYIVSKDGRIFLGNSGGEERKISVVGMGDDMVVIGYLAGRSDRTFDPRAEDVLSGLIIDIANRNQIRLGNVDTAAVSYSRNDSEQKVILEKKDVFGLWQTGLDKIVNKVKGQYKPVSKQYKLEVVEVGLPDTKVDPGENIVGNITVKNTGEFGLYGDTVAELIATKLGAGGSRFYSNGHWLSRTQFGLMQPDSILLPGDEAQFDYRLEIPLYFGKQTETFQLQTISGYKIPGSKFTVSLNIKRPSGTIVEVKDTETGWLRVRAAASSVATEVARISTGDRYFVLSDAGNGWVKLKLENGRTGWVSKQYLRYL